MFILFPLKFYHSLKELSFIGIIDQMHSQDFEDQLQFVLIILFRLNNLLILLPIPLKALHRFVEIV